MGINGNKWAWQQNRWASVEEFQKSQRRWKPWGIVFLFLPIVLGILAAITVVSVSSARKNGGFSSGLQTYNPSPITVSSSTSETTDQYDWVDYTSEAGDFQARFPTEPEHASQDVPSGDGLVATIDTYVSKPSDGDAYLVLKMAMPSAGDGAAEFLAGAVQGFVEANGDYSLVSKASSGSNSIDFLVKNSNPDSSYRYIKGRFILVRGSVYQLLVYYSKLDEGSYAEFINSFKLR